jgi:hypothetical protein
MVILVSLFIWFLTSTNVFAGDTKDVGSAATLEGRVRLAVVFISDENSNWSLKEQHLQLRRLKRGQDWLTKQSLAYNTDPVQYRHRIYGRFRDIKLTELPSGTRSGNENVDMVNLVSWKLGFDSPQQWRSQFSDEQFVALLFLKRDGASYAIPQETGLDSRYDIEGAVLYNNFEPGIPNCATCMAHEILHVFGAWDMYETFQITKEQMDMASQIYPNSIMLRTSYNPEELTLDPVTCWRIGWCSKPEEAETFRPNQRY